MIPILDSEDKNLEFRAGQKPVVFFIDSKTTTTTVNGHYVCCGPSHFPVILW